MKVRILFFLLVVGSTALKAQDYPRSSEFHGNVKSVEQHSFKAKKNHGTIISGRTAHEFRGEVDFRLEYDSSGRTTGRTLYSNVSKQPFWSIDYSYDSLGHVIQSRKYRFKQGLTEITNYENVYDEQGRLVMRTARDQAPGPLRRWRYAYDAKGFVTEFNVNDSTMDPDGLKLSYSDARGNILKEWDYTGAKLSTYTEYNYDSLGYKTEERLYNRSAKLIYVLHWKYSAKHELERYENCSGNSHSCESWNYKYQYDANGNWTRRVEYRNGKPVLVKERTITYY